MASHALTCQFSQVFTRLLRVRQPALSQVATTWHQAHPKGEYKKQSNISNIKAAKEGIKQIIPETKLWAEEFRTKLRCDSLVPLEHEDYEITWRFKEPCDLDDWVVTTDYDNNEGKSTANFVINKNKNGLFYGTLDTEKPQDGKKARTGYCSIRSPLKRKSFHRNEPYDWTEYTHLLFRVRGDGRSYMINIAPDRYYDVMWDDRYAYILFTRGGPYWQTAKIPFSKFFLSHKGRIQDKQQEIPLSDIKTLGITCSDSHAGPFQLEIDYIGLYYDEFHKEEFAYEMYEVSPFSIC